MADGSILADVTIAQFGGLDTATKNQDDLDASLTGIAVSPNALNWLTGAAIRGGKYYGDHIELRRGYAILGENTLTGNVPVSGLGVGSQQNGTQIPFFTSGRHLYYYDLTNNLFTELNATSNISGQTFQVDTGNTLLTNLISYYPMEGNSNDFYGSYNGTDTAITYGTSYGIVKQGASFDGATSKINLPTINGITTTMSVSFWMNSSETDQGIPIGFFNAADTEDIWIALNRGGAGKLDVCMRNGLVTLFFTSVTTVNDGKWHHVVVTRDGATATLYIDGVIDSSSSSLYDFSVGLDHWSLGYNRNNSAQLYAGDIDEVGIWSRVLIQQEITDLYNSGDGQTLIDYVLPVSATNDDFSIIPYQNLAGYYVFLSSQNSSVYKIVAANPTSIIDYQDYETCGFIGTNQGRLFLWNRGGRTTSKDSVGLYLSNADGASASSNPPFVTKNGIEGNATNGTDSTFTGTLVLDNTKENAFGVQIAAPTTTPTNITAITAATLAVITSAGHGLSVGDIVTIEGVSGMTEINNLIANVIRISGNDIAVSINSSLFLTYTSGGTIGKSELMTDDRNGNMKSVAGGIGTINYVTGAYSVTFSTPPITGFHLNIAFFEDDPSNNGMVVFPIGTPSSATDGMYLSQYGYGTIMNVLPLSGLYFCFHEFGTYQLLLYNNDTTSDSTVQQVYRSNVGIPYWRAAYPTGDGLLYMDTLNSSNPKLRNLALDYSVSSTNPAIVPQSLSDQIDLTQNAYNYTAVYEWGDYYILECQGFNNGVADTANDVMYVYSKKTGYIDKLDYRARCFASYYGALIGGDSISPNLLLFFSGFDDNGFNINNYWQSSSTFLGAMGIKTFNRLSVKGLITPSQSLDVYLAYDNGNFVKLGTVDGNSSYVNIGSPVEVGGQTIGTNIVGGGGTVNAFPFEIEFTVGSDLFNRVAIKFVATSVGYVEVDSYTFKDIALQSREIMPNLAQ